MANCGRPVAGSVLMSTAQAVTLAASTRIEKQRSTIGVPNKVWRKF
jgi:hypothetical protein